MEAWQQIPDQGDANHNVAVPFALRSLELQLILPCQKFRLYNGQRIEQSTIQHESVLARLTWGMTGIGVLGGVAGIVLGFGVSKIMAARSVPRIQQQAARCSAFDCHAIERLQDDHLRPSCMETNLRKTMDSGSQLCQHSLELAQIRELVSSALRTSQLMLTAAALARTAGDQLIGQCPAMRELYKAIGRVAASNVTALLLGETGTGKELVARAIYRQSHRADKPFLAMNCAAIPEQLLESELSGLAEDAFSGADR